MFIRLLILSFALNFSFAAPSVVLFNDTSAWYHWGCTGTSTALKEQIASLGFEIEAFPIQMTYSLKQVPPFDAFDNLGEFEKFCEANPEVLQAIQKADCIVITGEGTIHDLRTGPQALLYLAHISKIFFRKHVEIINHSAYPKDDPIFSSLGAVNLKELEKAQAIYQKIYSELDFVAIREPLSQNEMARIGIDSTLSFDCLPLYIRDHYQKPKQIEKNTVVLAGSVAFTEEGALSICRYLEEIVRKGYKVKVLIGAAASPAKDDLAYVDFLRAHCTAEWELVDAKTIDEWLDTINRAALLISGRFHHSIAAFCLQTPFIALNSNTHKVHSLCLKLGHKEPLLFSDPELFEKLLKEMAESETADSREKLTEIWDLADRNFDGLKNYLNRQAP